MDILRQSKNYRRRLKQKVIDNDKKAMHDADINLSDNKKKLEDAKNELGNLQKQKEEQR